MTVVSTTPEKLGGLSPATKLRLLVAAVVQLGVAGVVGAVIVYGDRPVPEAWRLALAVGVGLLAELSLIHIRFGHTRQSFTWSETCILVGLALVPPPWLILLAPLAAAVVHLSARRPPMKLMFNAAAMATSIMMGQFILAGVTGGAVGNYASGTLHMRGLRFWVGLLCASMAIFVWNNATVAGAVALSQGMRYRDVLFRGITLSTLVWAGNTAVGMALVAVSRFDDRALVALPVVLAVSYLVYRGYLRKAQEAQTWRLLNTTFGGMTRLEEDDLVHSVMTDGAAMFEAEFVELLVVREEGHATLYRQRGTSPRSRRDGTPMELAPGLWPLMGTARDPFRVRPGRMPEPSAADMADLGLADSLVAPLLVSTHCVGMLRLGFLGPVKTSDRELQVLRTFAQHLASSVFNAVLFAATHTLFRQASDLLEWNGALTSSLGEAIVAVDNSGRVTFVNPAGEALLGRSGPDVEGRVLHDLVHGPDAREVGQCQPGCMLADAAAAVGTERSRGEVVWRADGTRIPVDFTVSPLRRDDRVVGAVLALRDVSERQNLEDALTYQAFHDSTTKAANRALFLDRLQHAMDKRSRGHLAVLFIDLDRFKVVNDSLGHRAGDSLLAQVAARLQACLRPSDTLARFGGDEFTVLLEDVDDGLDVVVVAERMLAAMGRPFWLAGKDFVVSASIGVAMVDPSSAADVQEVIHRADVAMYHAKSEGRARYEVYRPELDGTPLDLLEIETALRRGIDRDEFQVHYQPVVDVRTGVVEGVEALVRWNSPGGLRHPGEFIDLAEETGLILPLGRRVLEDACRQVRRWHLEHPNRPPVVLSVNLSARQMDDSRLVPEVRRILTETGLEPQYLCLEITETVIMRNVPSTMAVLVQLRDIGVRIAIDDFGTGYSSLSYLKRFPVDTVKIDRSFVEGMGQENVDFEIVAAVIRLTRSLGIKSVAEGVETLDQIRRLTDLGCSLLQGYYFSTAQPAEHIEALIERGTELTLL